MEDRKWKMENGMQDLLNNIWVLFFSLDRKERKDQDCKSLAKNFIRNAMEIKLVPIDESIFIEYRDLEQKFPFNAFLIHSFNVKYLRSGKHLRG